MIPTDCAALEESEIASRHATSDRANVKFASHVVWPQTHFADVVRRVLKIARTRSVTMCHPEVAAGAALSSEAT
jgi:hypothetical protein